MKNIRPLSDHVFIEPIEEDKLTKSGIVLPDTAEKEKPIKGRVVAVGNGKRTERGELLPLSVKVGDVVLFKKYGPDEIEIDGKKYLVGEESDILAILEEGPGSREPATAKKMSVLQDQLNAMLVEGKNDNEMWPLEQTSYE